MTGDGGDLHCFEAIVALLGERTGLQFPPKRYAYAEAGIRRAMMKAAVDRPETYFDRLRSGAVSLDDLVEEVTVGETYFFRDLPQFEAIRKHVLPDLTSRLPSHHPIEVWSAGCATGEEAYSLAILMEETGLASKTHIFGTDISRSALAAARRGVFGAWSLRGDPLELASRYFQRRGARFALIEPLRSRVEFAHLNLASGDYSPVAARGRGADLVLCRNVLIYFSGEVVQRVGQRLLDALAPGGWLVTGPSDPLLPVAAPFETVLTAGGVFYRRTGIAVTPVRARAVEQAPIVVATERKPPQPARISSPPRPKTEETETAVASAVERVRRLGDLGAVENAETAASEASARHPLSTELHFLHGMLLLEQGRYDAAVAAMRRVLYLDPTLVAAQLSLGSILRRKGNRTAAYAAYQRGHEIAVVQPPDKVMALSDGASAAQLVSTARREMATLDLARDGTP